MNTRTSTAVNSDYYSSYYTSYGSVSLCNSVDKIERATKPELPKTEELNFKKPVKYFL